MEKEVNQEKLFPCLVPGTRIYTNCRGMDCEFYDPWRLSKGCLFWNPPRVATRKGKRVVDAGGASAAEGRNEGGENVE